MLDEVNLFLPTLLPIQKKDFRSSRAAVLSQKETFSQKEKFVIKKKLINKI